MEQHCVGSSQVPLTPLPQTAGADGAAAVADGVGTGTTAGAGVGVAAGGPVVGKVQPPQSAVKHRAAHHIGRTA